MYAFRLASYILYVVAFICFVIGVFTWWFPIAGQIIVILVPIFGIAGYTCSRIAKSMAETRAKNAAASSGIRRY